MDDATLAYLTKDIDDFINEYWNDILPHYNAKSVYELKKKDYDKYCDSLSSLLHDKFYFCNDIPKLTHILNKYKALMNKYLIEILVRRISPYKQGWERNGK